MKFSNYFASFLCAMGLCLSSSQLFASANDIIIKADETTWQANVFAAGETIAKEVMAAHKTGEKYPVVYFGEYHGYPSYLTTLRFFEEFPSTLRKCVFLEGNTTGSQEMLNYLSKLALEVKPDGENLQSVFSTGLEKYFLTHKEEKLDYQQQLQFSDNTLFGPFLIMFFKLKVFSIDYGFRKVNQSNQSLMAGFANPNVAQQAFDDLVSYHLVNRHAKATSGFVDILNKVNCDLKFVIFGSAHYQKSEEAIKYMNEFVRGFYPYRPVPSYTSSVITEPLQDHISKATKLNSFLVTVGIKGMVEPASNSDLKIIVEP